MDFMTRPRRGKALHRRGSLRLHLRPRQEALDAAVADLGPNARAVKGSVSDLADLDRLYAAVKAEESQLALGKIAAGCLASPSEDGDWL
jgi:hypothetical protein